MTAGTGQGKLLLFGEHAAVFGYPAVGMSLPLTTTVEILADGDTASEVSMLFDDALQQITMEEGSRPAGLEARTIRVESNVPMSVGLGSSAALTVATARAAASSVGMQLSDPEIWLTAHQLEKRYHGTPSGIDTGLATLGGTYAFRRDSDRVRPAAELPTAELLRTPRLFMVVVALARQRSTKELVAEVRRRRESDGGRTQHALEQLGMIAAEATDLLTAEDAGNDADHIGVFANQAQQNLRAIGVSSDRVESTVKQLLGAGATGAKLSGAGGGGAVFGVFSSATSAQAGLTATEDSENAHGWLFELDARGVHLRQQN